MVATVITSERGTTVSLNDNDEYYLQQGALHHLLGSAITAAFNSTNLDVFVFGDIFSQNTAIALGNASNSTITIGHQGSIVTKENQRPIDATGDNVDVINHGLIVGGQMEVDGDNSTVVNTGVISGVLKTAGPFHALRMTGTNAQVLNSGVIQAASDNVMSFLGDANVANSGLIQGTLVGIDASLLAVDESLKVTNTGVITVSTTSILGGAGGDKIDNAGTITGAIDLRSGNDTFVNSGNIHGDVDLGSDNDKLVNSGTINGMVDLGAENDTFKMVGNGFVSDVINGEGGNDTIRGGAFDDTIDGGLDDDLLRGKNGEDDLTGGTGNDTIFGGNGDDSLTGDDGDDDLRGGNGDDTLLGGGNRDELVGGAGNDTMEGGAGNDTLRGGAGDDTLAGQNGSDDMSGGAGADIFLFTNASHSAVGGRDDILDFQKGQDKIDIDGLSNDTFVFLGNSAFTASGEAELRVSTNAAGNSVVRIDVDGDGTADSEINVLGVTGLEAGDFIL